MFKLDKFSVYNIHHIYIYTQYKAFVSIDIATEEAARPWRLHQGPWRRTSESKSSSKPGGPGLFLPTQR